MKREAPIQDRTIALCMKVTGKIGEKTQEEVFLEFDAALEQSDIFQAAGYKDVVIQPAYVAYDADEDRWYFAKIEETATIKGSAVPARHSRADGNPGIKVRDYDRERERERNQNVTVLQLVVATIAVVSMVVAPGFFIGMLLSDGAGMTVYTRAIFTSICMIATGVGMLATPWFRSQVFADAALLAGIRWVDKQ